jgi:hypothetical protein
MTLLNPPDTYGYTIFCDDIRHEVDGKINFIGTYAGTMFVNGTFPIALPKFGFGMTLLQRREILVANVAVRIFLPGDIDDTPSIHGKFAEINEGTVAEQTAAEVAQLPKDEISYVGLHLNLIVSPLVINAPGVIKVRAVRGDDMVRLGAMRIVPVAQQAPSADASPKDER